MTASSGIPFLKLLVCPFVIPYKRIANTFVQLFGSGSSGLIACVGSEISQDRGKQPCERQDVIHREADFKS